MENGEAGAQTTLSTIIDITNLNSYMRSYLSFRACGFTFREACKLAGVGETTVRRWRDLYPEFAGLDSKEHLKELVDKFSYRYLELEFLKNYRLVLKKDYDVLAKSIYLHEDLTSSENQYLLKLRSHYTPEQLAVIKKLVEVGTAEEVSFSQLILQLGQEQLKLSASDYRAKGEQTKRG